MGLEPSLELILESGNHPQRTPRETRWSTVRSVGGRRGVFAWGTGEGARGKLAEARG